MYKLILKVVLTCLCLILLVGCQQTPYVITTTPNTDSPTPTREAAPTEVSWNCDGIPGEGFYVISPDPCLEGRVNSTLQEDVQQDHPYGWSLYNVLETVEGLTGPSFFTEFAPISYNDRDGYEFDIAAKAGRWGFTTPQIALQNPECLLIKVTGYARVEEIESYDTHNISLRVYLTPLTKSPVDLLTVTFPERAGTYESIWTVIVASPQTFRVTAVVQSNYATATSGTEISIRTISVSVDSDGDHCEGSFVPTIR